MINDGTKDSEALLQSLDGCDANFRYHEDRADFSVRNATRLKVRNISYESNNPS
jgi:hypothetical protein